MASGTTRTSTGDRVDRHDRTVSALTTAQRVQYGIIVCIWCAAALNFWFFWFTLPAPGSWLLYCVMTVAFFYETTLLPTVYLFFLGHMRRPVHIPAPRGLKVAIITLCVPSKESLEIIERQIRQMVAVTYPHDSWVLDEENNAEVARLCRAYGVHHFTRHGVAEWNQPSPPFQAKTKAGNVNAWLFRYGKDYEFFVQLDIDHHPVPAYLDRVLGHFQHQQVAWIQAPSVYGNLGSWTARGSAEQELVLQGPLQMGFYGFSHTPFIIGSHSTYRVSAMLEIGGMQPTRAEDHLDTVVLAQHGYGGVFVPEVIATGEGPEAFDTYLAQQFAWAYSMIQVLFQYSFGYARQYRARTALQFLFVQTWYTCWSLSMVILFALPSWMLITGQSIGRIPLGTFLLAYAPLLFGALGIWGWSRRWFQPQGLRLSWRGIVLHVARWPVVFWAFINVLFKVKRPYMITPKGTLRGHRRPFNVRAQGPYLALSLGSLVAAQWYISTQRSGAPQGYLLWTIQGTLFMLLVFWLALVQDIRSLRQEGVSRLQMLQMRSRPLLLGLLLLALTGWTGARSLPLIIEAATWNGEPQPSLVGQAGATPVAPPRPSPSVASSLPPPPAPTSTPTPPPGQASPSVASFLPAPPAPSTSVATPTPPVVEEPDFMATARQERFFGAYDPQYRLLDERFEAELFYTDLFPQSLARLEARLRLIRAYGRTPVVTLEPWPLMEQGLGAETLLTDLASGRYDAQLQQVAQALRDYQGQVLLRFAHEMELAEIYPWGQGEPQQYIAAYRHVHDLLQREAGGKLLWIWSPAGNVEAPLYYPGDDVVDYVGITLLGSHEFDRLSGAQERRTFEQLMAEKYARARAFGKPVLIAELGVSGSEDLQTAWLREMFSLVDQYPDLRGLIYFNDFNAVNRLVPDPPDYRISNQQWHVSRLQAHSAAAPATTAAPAPTATATPEATPTAIPTATPDPVPTPEPEPPPPPLGAVGRAIARLGVPTPEPAPPPPPLPPPPLPPAPTPPPAFVATDRVGTTVAVNLRTGPGTSSPSQGVLPRGTPLRATGETAVVKGEQWRRFRLADGRVGWIRDLDTLPMR